ncbi:Transposase [Cordylochernes scorpioides]|uniref:Transposase n=1 Tax=Cordylochernes scorpioides TaxID=51811 RepID=A0ABY6LXZ8_9ARAC|nr:Transposase [Cordylochernes scorpioides]
MPGHRKRRQFKQTDAFTRGMVIGLKRAGWSIRQIAADTHLGASTVHRLWRRWLEQGNVAIYRNVGATRVTSARVDRRILRQAVAAPQATCTAILQHVQDTLDHSISTRTISRRLVANGLHSCRPLRRLPLTPPNRRQRLEWCRARSTWMTEWHRVVFSDESRFCLSSDSRRVRVWRRRGERSNPAAIVERPTVRQRHYDGPTNVDDVLRPVTLPYLQGVPNALYQQDNARPHNARISQQALQDVQMLPWPPYSPDLSPIEHVWDIIGRRLHALPQPRSEDELWQMVEREWRAIPQDAIRTLIDSLPRRVAACIAVRGGMQKSIGAKSADFTGVRFFGIVLIPVLCLRSSNKLGLKIKVEIEFKCGRTSLEDDPRKRRPKTGTTPETIEKVHNIVLDDRRVIMSEIAKIVGISEERVRVAARVGRDPITARGNMACYPHDLNGLYSYVKNPESKIESFANKKNACTNFSKTFAVAWTFRWAIIISATLEVTSQTNESRFCLQRHDGRIPVWPSVEKAHCQQTFDIIILAHHLNRCYDVPLDTRLG